MSRSALRLACAALLALCMGTPAAALTQTFGATKDTQVDSKDNDVNFGNWTTAAVGFTAGGLGRINRTLLQFDLSALASGSVNQATLRVFIESSSQDPLGLPVTISQLVSDFVEGDGIIGVTWDTQPGVFPSPLAMSAMNTSPGSWFEVDVTALIRAALQRTTAAEIGLRVAATDESVTETSVFTMRTKEFAAGEFRPQLVISVAPVSEAPALSGSAMVVAVALLLLAGYRFLGRPRRSAP